MEYSASKVISVDFLCTWCKRNEKEPEKVGNNG